MSQNEFLSKFAAIISVLGVCLYYTGWIYRWSYFGFFKLEVTTLDFPLESFFIVPIQVFFGDNVAIFKTIAALLCLSMVILLAKLLKPELVSTLNWFHEKILQLINKLNWRWMSQKLGNPPIINSSNFPPSLLSEIFLVSLLLFTLFQLANTQGTADAWRDAASKESTLPVVALVTPDNNLGLGRKLNDISAGPNLKNWSIMGDNGLYNDILGSEINNKRVWRLLLHRNGFFYLFLQMPENANRDQRPSVIAIKEGDGGNQLMIISPEASKNNGMP